MQAAATNEQYSTLNKNIIQLIAETSQKANLLTYQISKANQDTDSASEQILRVH